MSINPDSPYHGLKESRNKISDMSSWFGSSSKAKKCVFCQQKAFTVVENDKRLIRCTKGCRDTELPPQQSNNDSKFKSKYGSQQSSNSFIISQPRRKTKVLSDEEWDKEYIKSAFGSTSATLVDSREDNPPI